MLLRCCQKLPTMRWPIRLASRNPLRPITLLRPALLLLLLLPPLLLIWAICCTVSNLLLRPLLLLPALRPCQFEQSKWALSISSRWIPLRLLTATLLLLQPLLQQTVALLQLNKQLKVLFLHSNSRVTQAR